ncbi:hypothetical protein PSTG_15032, partial [Puccinia striiformis f. sp. tritici PST-78]
MVVRQDVGLSCPTGSSCPSTAQTSQSDDSSDGYVQESLGHAGPRTCWTGMSDQLIEALVVVWFKEWRGMRGKGRVII